MSDKKLNIIRPICVVSSSVHTHSVANTPRVNPLRLDGKEENQLDATITVYW